MGDPIWPLLKPFDWMGRTVAACRRLLPDNAREVPWLGFGYDHPDTFQFLNADQLFELGKTQEEIEAEAIAHLSSMPAQWKEYAPGKLLVYDADYFAAERVLDAGFLRDAAKLLGTTLLAVGIPRRHILLAAPAMGNGDDSAMLQFARLCQEFYTSGEAAPIAPFPLLVRDGEIIGRVQVELPPDDDAEPVAQGQQSEDEGITARAALFEGKNGTNVHLFIGVPRAERLGDVLMSTFSNLIEKTREIKDFSGVIEIFIHEGAPPDSPEVRKMCHDFELILKRAVDSKGLTTAAGKPLAVSLRYGEGEGADS